MRGAALADLDVGVAEPSGLALVGQIDPRLEAATADRDLVRAGRDAEQFAP